MRIYPSTPYEMVASLLRNRSLIKASIKREVLGRYRGSLLGILWSFFNPLFMLVVYTLVFSGIFKARWSVGSNSKLEFALVLFSGLLTFNLFAECVSRAPGLVLNTPNYVKKVVFPLEILPWISLGSALFHLGVSLSVWVLAYILFFGTPLMTVLYVPLVLLPYAIFIMGLSWILASLGVFLRDVSQVVSIIINAMMFLSPIFYPTTALPESVRPILYMNPLTPAIEFIRNVLYWGKQPDFKLLAIYLLFTTCFAWLGFFWFQKTRKGFADVI